MPAELIVARLQQRLRDKDLKLTDIQLEALTSAHQLDNLRDAMTRMQVRHQLPLLTQCRLVCRWYLAYTI